ncbi:ribonuclease HII [Ahrensia sp. R2A130]|uniref:ribonuclease HII n=1 Tax=Ahrensia sp. R2A130 TaxID=744979 RepID=UPI0001E0CA11|nr:ribonuclease HII [Ahrensia sp. R2A130]EFL88829.1 ribonuclease HII [Ahrensia sp. R2A130]
MAAFQPDFTLETLALSKGIKNVCGVDEAGRGPLAGPVIAAAVILDPDNIPSGLNDSKALTEKRRSELFDAILATSQVAFATVAAGRIDAMNIRAASLYAMEQSVRALPVCANHALIDGNALPPNMPCSAEAIVKGDARSLSIAAASIIAKVMRDRIMVRADTLWPQYGFSGHKGYPTAAHRDALARLGPCQIHRMSFRPVRNALVAKA